jgi:high-affinity iron transporter
MFSRVLLLLFTLCASVGLRAAVNDKDQKARMTVHLLDYIAQDYSAAVKDGIVIDDAEYQEMTEFCRSARSLAENFLTPPIETEIQEQFQDLSRLIQQRAAAPAIAETARRIRQQIIRVSNLTLAPSRWPDSARGRILYAQNCAACHGAEGKGDGSAGATLDPKPSNFHDAERMRGISPFQAFNTIRLGVQGTAMAAFSQLEERDAWDLAFYVVSLRHHERARALIRDGVAVPRLPLAQLAKTSDAELEQSLAPRDRASLALVRAAFDQGDHAGSLSLAREHLAEALKLYETGNFNSAREHALQAYLDGVEPVESQLRTIASSLLPQLEKKMADVRRAIETRRELAEVQRAVSAALTGIEQAEHAFQQRSLSPWLVFSMAMAILFREGFEAVLVIVAILGVLRGTQTQSVRRWVHGGWIFSDWLMGISGLQREFMEALTSLLAVTVLLAVGFWMHSKTEIGRWRRFIEGQIKAAVGRNRFGLALISFLAVFREALETVLFLSALSIQGGPATRGFVLAGVISALALVFLVAWLLMRFAARLPVRTLFAVSSSLMGILAVILAGKGLHSLQESGVLSMTDMPFTLRIDLIGLYPTLETVLFQAIILMLAVILWIYSRRPDQALAAH